MDFAASTKYLYSLGNEVSAMKLGLENIRTLLDALGKPHEKYLKVQIAGTNGKGSVCAFLNSICLAAGVKTGLYTSPHLVSITERVKINGIDISEKDFARHATNVRETAEKLLANGDLEYLPTFFEQMTAIALIAFADAKVELAILETGLGGRLDATTAANAEIAAITRIDLDHQEYLGDTIEQIAAEKAAIIHAGSKVVIGEQQKEPMVVLVNHCEQLKISPSIQCESWIEAIDTTNRSAVVIFRTENELYHDPNLGLKGRHQVENARIAVMVSEILRFDFGLNVTPDSVVEGLENARHPGRLEYVGQYFFDGAHNIGGANALAEFIREFETRPITLVFGAMHDKSVAEILAILAPLAQRIIVTEPSNSRSLSYEEILEQMPTNMSKERTFATDNVKSAIDIASAITSDDGIILVTGSLYLVGEVKGILQSQI